MTLEISPSNASEQGALGLHGNEEARQKEFRELSFNSFAKKIIGLNARFRGINPALHDFDGEGVFVGGEIIGENGEEMAADHTPPDQKDKQGLLDYALTTAQSLESIQDAALLMAASINQIHIFADGNGRISRVIYAELAAGDDFLQKNYAEITSGRESIDIGSYIPNRYLLGIAKQRLGSSASDSELRAEACKVLCDAFKEPDKYVLQTQDIPISRFKVLAEKGITLHDYLVVTSLNLVSSRLANSHEKVSVTDEQGRVQNYYIPKGFQQDTRFKGSNH